MKPTPPCKICRGQTEQFAEARILGKYAAVYARCHSCGFVSVTDPCWLDEVYQQAITSPDIGTVSRCMNNTPITRAFLHLCFDPNGTFLDYGAGYGMFVRYLRDKGYDFHWYDAHCENLFAQRFEGDTSGDTNYTLLTCFEVFEHLTDPMAELDRMFRLSRNLLFSTELVSSPPPMPSEWWYYGLDHGQHVSFFSRESLEYIAKIHRVRLYSLNSSVHLLCERAISRSVLTLISIAHFRVLFDFVIRRRSLLGKDFHCIRQQIAAELGIEFVPSE